MRDSFLTRHDDGPLVSMLRRPESSRVRTRSFHDDTLFKSNLDSLDSTRGRERAKDNRRSLGHRFLQLTKFQKRLWSLDNTVVATKIG